MEGRFSVEADIRAALARGLVALDISVADHDIQLEHTADFTHGDYASNVAMTFAKQLKMNPRELAEKLAVEARDVEGVESVEVAGPGFINFTLGERVLAERLLSGRKQVDAWGGNDSLKGQCILVEYTSPNLFKPLHIGNLVGNVIGESIARLFECAGANVKRINYPSDIGLPVAKCVWGLQKNSGDPHDIHSLGDAYRAGNEAYENDPAAKERIDVINKALYEDSDKELTALRTAGVKTSRKHLEELCKKLGTKFDLEFFESETGPIGRDIVLKHEGTIFEKSDGAIVYKGEKVGLHTRVFVNSAGLPTYEAKDLGNFELKRKKYPKWDRSYIVVGIEQQEYLKVVFAVIREVFPEAKDKVLEHIANGFLALTTGKMSSRKGNVLTGEELLSDLEDAAKERAAESRADDIEQLAEDIAVGALKFQILKGGASKNIVFDKERALSLEGDSGPYLQYAHARARAVVEKARKGNIEKVDAAEFTEQDNLVRLVYRFPEVVQRATEHLEPHLLTTYLTDLAGAFNSWYSRTPILDSGEHAPSRVATADAVCRTLKKGLTLLGIPAPEKV